MNFTDNLFGEPFLSLNNSKGGLNMRRVSRFQNHRSAVFTFLYIDTAFVFKDWGLDTIQAPAAVMQLHNYPSRQGYIIPAYAHAS